MDKNELTYELLEKTIKKIVNESFEEREQSDIEKFKSKIDDITNIIERKYENKFDNLQKYYKNEVFKKPSWAWSLVITALLFLVFNIGCWVIAKWDLSIDNKIKDYQTFCEKIVDEKIKNILNNKQK